MTRWTQLGIAGWVIVATYGLYILTFAEYWLPGVLRDWCWMEVTRSGVAPGPAPTGVPVAVATPTGPPTDVR